MKKEESMLPKENKSLVLGLVHLLCHSCFAKQLGEKCSSAWAELIHFSLISLFTNQTEKLTVPTALFAAQDLFANELEKLLIQTVRL